MWEESYKFSSGWHFNRRPEKVWAAGVCVCVWERERKWVSVCMCVCVSVQMMLLLCCEMFYCLYWSVVDSELSFKMFSVLRQWLTASCGCYVRIAFMYACVCECACVRPCSYNLFKLVCVCVCVCVCVQQHWIVTMSNKNANYLDVLYSVIIKYCTWNWMHWAH